MPTDLGYSTNVKIGTTVYNVEDVKVEPVIEFFPGINPERTACGGDRWQGSPRCRWTYPDRLLSGEQYYQLQKFVGDSPSAAVVIQVPTQRVDTTTYQPVPTTYSAIMHWPEEGVAVVSNNRWQIEEILFTNLQGI